MSEILQETTEWAGQVGACNHTYLLDNQGKILAYVKQGQSKVEVLRTPLKIDKRYRTFVRVKHPALSRVIQKSNPDTRIFKIVSGEKEYFVEKTESKYTCTCTGYNFRGKCKHIDGVVAKLQQPA